MTLLRVENVSKSYRSDGKVKQALTRGLSLTVGKVKLSGLLGKVAVGKVRLHVSLCNLKHLMRGQFYSMDRLLQSLREKHFMKSANSFFKMLRLPLIHHGRFVKFYWNLFEIEKGTERHIFVICLKK